MAIDLVSAMSSCLLLPTPPHPGFRIFGSNSHPSPINGYRRRLGRSLAASRKRGFDFNGGGSGFKGREDKGYGFLDKVADFETESGGDEGGLLSSCGDGLQLVGAGDVSGENMKVEEQAEAKGGRELRRGRQLVKRSSILAKQVISIQTALCLGFVSQLWVDASSWEVLIVEVRQNLLSTDSEKLLLQDIKQVGDVILIQDESAMTNEYRMVGLETLVGYEVVTPGGRTIGKVRGYLFNIDSGTVESIELDSLGLSIIPSSLVSTYSVFIEDVMEVISDTIIVHEAAASRIQRVTKGIWGCRNIGRPIFDMKYSDLDEEPLSQQDEGGGRKGRRSFRRKSGQRGREMLDDWELPMDYL